MKVTKNNVEDYLQAIAEHYLKKPFEEVIAAFSEGFNSIFPL
jgi:hypothetical protein